MVKILKFRTNWKLNLPDYVIKNVKGGGFYLAIHPAEFKVATIIRLVNGPIAMLPCVSLYFYKRCENCNEKRCALHDMMIEVRDATLNIVEKRTLIDLMES